MKIAYLICGCGVSGGLAVICQHVNRLLVRGHEVLLISESSERKIDWFPNQRVPIIGLADIPYDLDILVATAWSTSFNVAILPAKHKFYFVQSDETRFHSPGTPWEHITRMSYALNYNYITEAKWIKSWLKNGFGYNAELIPNGLDEKIFYQSKPLLPKKNKIRILLEGAIGLPYKGMAEAFKAINNLDVEVWCVSSYGKPDPSWKCDNFFYQVPMTEMRKIYSSCDILLKLSRVEGFFGPPMEMMACGGLVIVGKVTGYDEYIKHEFNALVVDPLKPEEATQAIRRLISDKDLRATLLKNGKMTAKQWQWENSIDRLEKHFKDVVNKSCGVKPNKDKDNLSKSISYFYRQLMEISPIKNFKDSRTQDYYDKNIYFDIRINSKNHKEESLPNLDIQKNLATTKMLSWLEKKIMFRWFALLAFRLHKMKSRFKS